MRMPGCPTVYYGGPCTATLRQASLGNIGHLALQGRQRRSIDRASELRAADA